MIIHWYEAVQKLFRTYFTKYSITETLEDFDGICYNKNENETAYAARLNNAAYRCGNVHDEDKKINLYVRGILPALEIILQRFRNSSPPSELYMERIVQTVQKERDSYSSRLPVNQL